MSSTREMLGITSFANSKLGALEIGEMVARSPQPCYTCKCGRCGVRTTIGHATIQRGDDRCKNSSCGRETISRQLADDRKAGKREAVANAAALDRQAREAASREAALRMEADTASHHVMRPLTEFRPTESGPMSERQRLAGRQRREEEAAEKEARFAPVREAEAKLKDTHRKIAAVQRDTFLNPEIIDIEPFISEGFVGAEMSWGDAKIFNGWEAKHFIEAHPEFMPSENNLALLGDYFDRNNLCIITREMVENLYQRMVDAGVPFDSPPPAPKPRPAPEPSHGETTHGAATHPSHPAKPTSYQGFDLESGLPRNYSAHEIDRMTADEMRNKFHIYKADLALPNIGPGPLGWQQE